jgi:hypothetical protein
LIVHRGDTTAFVSEHAANWLGKAQMLRLAGHYIGGGVVLRQSVCLQSLGYNAPQLLRRLSLPLGWDVRGKGMDRAFQQDADQEVGISSPVTNQLDQLCDKPNLIGFGRRRSFSLSDQIIDCWE